jgi:DNA-directed RNA polymerase subunit RPC12/RpoP
MKNQPPLSRIACAACGAGVVLSSGATTVVCTFCGNQQLVHPSIPVAHQVGQIGDSVGNVDRSTARLAAEMALPRLQLERQQCQARYDYLHVRQGDPALPWYVLTLVGSVAVSLFLAVTFSRIHELLGVVVFIVAMGAGIYLLVRVRRHFKRIGRTPDPELVALLAQLKSLDERIADNYRIANS